MHDGMSLPTDMDACHELISSLLQERDELTAQLQAREAEVEQQSQTLEARLAQLEEQSRTVIDLDAERKKLSQENDELKLTVEKLTDQIYRRRSERFVDPLQQYLDFGDKEKGVIEALDEAVQDAEKTLEEIAEKRKTRRRRKKPGNRKFPEHLPRYERIIDLPEEDKEGLDFIGYDEVETLEYVRSILRVCVNKYAKYSRPEGDVASPERPVGLVSGNRFDTSVAVEIIGSRFFYHLPYYRQQDLFAGCGWVPSRSTLLNIVTASEFVLQPLVNHYHSLLNEIDLVACDETTVTLVVPPALPELDPLHPRRDRILEVLSAAQAKGRPSVTARMWAYRAIELPFNLFDFTVSRHRDGPDEILKRFTGTLLGDCWNGFQKIDLRSDLRIERAACWAHARRKFDSCRTNHPVHATRILALIRHLYALETQAQLWPAADRLELRQKRSLPVLQQIRAYIDGPELARMLPKSDLAAAVGYLRNHWDALLLFTTDGRMPIDNNETEQLMKQVATGRKNWLHIGSVAAGMRAANLMTIVSTAIRNDLDVAAYLKDVLDQILAGCTDWDSLRADRWKEAHPEAVRLYRVDERRDAIERKRVRHATRVLQQQISCQP